MDKKHVLISLLTTLPSILFMLNDPKIRFVNIIPFLIPLILPLIIDFPSDIFGQVSRWFQSKLQTSAYNFTARLRLKAWRDEPDSIVRCFSALLWDWNHQNKTVNCCNLMEEFSSNGYWDRNEFQHNFNPIFIDATHREFWNIDKPHIRYKMWVSRSQDRDGIEHPEIFLNITMTNKDASPNQIIQHIQYIRDESKRIANEKKKTQKVLVSTAASSESEDGHSSTTFMTYEFATTSSFSNFFAEEARLIKNDIDYFLNKKEDYIRTGRPWTYTVLNEGPPGVGKTKLVKAIASLTKRTLIVINLNHIESIQSLYEVFHSSVLAGNHIEHTERLYYIPEVDTQMHAFTKQRSTETASILEIKDVKDSKDSKDGDKMKSAFKDEKKPTLGEVLNILDGVPERHGHIIIIDTNHLKELDDALIRPGRVDRIVSWGKMCSLSVRHYLENYYQKNVSDDIELPDKYYTAAELQSHTSRCSTLELFLSELPLKKIDG